MDLVPVTTTAAEPPEGVLRRKFNLESICYRSPSDALRPLTYALMPIRHSCFAAIVAEGFAARTLRPADHFEELMQEVFSKTTDANVPLKEQEYFELRLDDLGTTFHSQFIDSMGAVARNRFLVCETHAAWSEIDRNAICDAFEHDECSTLEEAQQRYECRRAAIVVKGFVCSDMEL